MVQEIQNLVRKLMEHVQTLIVVTVPPVPRLAENASHWKRLRIFNDRIKALDNGKRCSFGQHYYFIFRALSIFDTWKWIKIAGKIGMVEQCNCKRGLNVKQFF